LPDLAAALAASPALEKPIIAEKLAAARKAAGLADAADADDVEQIEQVILAERLSVSADGKPCCNHSPYAHAVTCDCQGIAAIQTLCKCGQPNTRLHLPVTALPADRMQVTGSTASSRPIITEVTDDTSTTQRAGATPAMPMPGLGGTDQAAQMRQMAQMLRSNPAMLGMMEGMMANLSQEQLDSMVRLAPCRRRRRSSVSFAR
jgi:hypothetical protein